eukprot:m.2811 g.2811  ORF g.2811 m.2811 type:complete len:720 (-) comp1948_c0_seq1:42-2201(-)
MIKTKQLKLKNFKAPKHGAAWTFTRDWVVLKEAVEAVFQHAPTNATLNGLCSRVERNLKLSGPIMYSNLKALVSTHIKIERERLQQCLSQPEHAFLATVASTWVTFKRDMHLVRSIFIHLNQELVATAQEEQLWPMSRNLFRKLMFSDRTLHEHVVNQFILAVTQDRNGETVDTNVLQKIAAMCSELQIYKSFLEKALETETRSYFANEGHRLTDELKLPDYLQHVRKRLGEEEYRCNTYLQSSSREILKLLVMQTLIAEHIPFIQQGFRALMEHEDDISLRLLFSFIRSLRRLDSFFDYIVSYIKEEGKKLVANPADDAGMVQRLVDFKDKVDRINQKSFSSTSSISIITSKTMDAFRYFINTRTNKPAELIALFLDSLLKRGFKQYTEANLQKLIEKVLGVFRFVEGKDVFEGFYKEALSRRLILDKIASNDLEITLISKLKQACGSEFTSNLEEMFKDIALSTDLTTEFKQVHQEVTIGLKVLVLKKATWPPKPPVKVALPKQLLDIRQSFTTFYANKHKNRLLHWQSNLSTCVLKAYFDAGEKDLSMSLYQASILLKFNEKSSWSYSELKRDTLIDETQLRLALTSLSCGKIRILLKEPKNRLVRKGDIFSVNIGFTNERRKVKINQIQLKQTKQENEATVAKVFEDRKLSVDAAIVRIMKMRKTLQHQNLIAELMAQLHFPVRPVDLKKRIEVMLDREYMERDKDDNSLYHYVA